MHCWFFFQPCILSSVYFITFLFAATWWALYKPLQRHIFNTLKRLVICYCALHFLLLYMYQIPFFQTIIPGQSLFARYDFYMVPIKNEFFRSTV